MTPGTRGSGLGIRIDRYHAAAALLLLLSLGRPAVSAEPQAVTFAARDGVQVSGVLSLPAKTPAPAVVLLPMLGRSHREWDATAAGLAEAGIAALAIDFRPDPQGTQPQAEGAGGAYSAYVLDAAAACAYLAARPDISAARVGMAGASIGANVAALAAGSDPSIRSLALLSVSLDYRGLKLEQALKKFGSRPALLVASSEDPFALRSAREAVVMGDGPRELRVLSGAGHGTVMLARDPDLASALVDWFVRTLL
jgi:dienelactone hydrolase